MAVAVGPMLRCSSEVIFVDPHFGPQEPRWRRYLPPLAAFLEEMIRHRPGGMPERIEVHTAAENTESGFFQEECERRLPQHVPERMRVLVRRLRQKQGGEQLHNRYILSDLGGISFGYGLDEGDEGATDDLALMDGDQYERRWAQYDGEPPAAFEQEGTPVEVVGTRRLPKP